MFTAIALLALAAFPDAKIQVYHDGVREDYEQCSAYYQPLDQLNGYCQQHVTAPEFQWRHSDTPITVDVTLNGFDQLFRTDCWLTEFDAWYVVECGESIFSGGFE